MRRMKKIVLVLAAVILVLPSFLATASTNDSKQEEVKTDQNGKVSSKDEVIYGTLSATGERKDIYVVNTLDVDKEGKIVDYGTYVSLKNLTDLSELEQADDQVVFTASEGKFYYQGNMNGEPLPWDIAVSYFLDGKEVSPEELAGQDGHVEINIETTANDRVDPVFFENYMLQISLPLDSAIFTNIKARDGMVANAGKNKQVTFTVMPESEEEFVVEADVAGFELTGIDITGVPSSMSIDTPDVDEMTGDMRTLSDAIADLNDGVAELHDGVSEMNSGVADLRDGSKQYQDGIAELDAGSSDLVNGSKDIEEALEMMSSSLGNSEEVDLSGMGELMDGLTAMSASLRETADGLKGLREAYQGAKAGLDGAITGIPSNVTPEELDALKYSNADQGVVKRLVDAYDAAQTAKGTYSEVKPVFDLVDEKLGELSAGLTEMADQLDTMVGGLSSSLEDMNTDGLDQLQKGLTELATNYKVFHSGLVDYTGGVGQLADSYSELHDGIVDLSDGTGELEDGVGELYDGTEELHDATNDLPDQMTDEIDQMISDFDKSDFDPVSFVSPENENVNTVQFVLKTESIKYEEPEVNEEPVEEKKGFWEKLMDLFR